MESILTSIKKMIGLPEDYIQFDGDLIIHINSVFMALNQLGVGPAAGFTISDKSKTWTDYLGVGTNIEAVKSYMYLKVRLMFDPPSSSAVIEAIERQRAELEWRILNQVEGGS